MSEEKKKGWLKCFNTVFQDDNSWNEKTIVGFMSFAVMVAIAGVDLGTGIGGKVLEIKMEIYYSFVGIVLGSFGIDGAQKIFEGKKDDKSAESDSIS